MARAAAGEHYRSTTSPGHHPGALSLFLGERLTHTGKIAADAVIGALPLFAIAALLQRWLVGGLTSGSVK